MFEIPACRAPQGRPFRATTNMSRHVFLSPFRKTSLPIRILLSSFMQEYPSANRHAAHQRFSLRLEAPKPGVLKGVARDAPSESSGQSQVTPLDSRPPCCRLPCPACLPGLAPITHRTPSVDSSQESVRKKRIFTFCPSSEPLAHSHCAAGPSPDLTPPQGIPSVPSGHLGTPYSIQDLDKCRGRDRPCGRPPAQIRT